jgi:hypothetical protein
LIHVTRIYLIDYFILGSDALEAAQDYVKDSKKKATKKAKETAEETSEAALKKKRKTTEL